MTAIRPLSETWGYLVIAYALERKSTPHRPEVDTVVLKDANV